MIKSGDIVESNNEVQIILIKKIKGKVIKVDEQAFGEFVYFITEENQLKCFKINDVTKIS
jgi:hypothetical protein